jgi:hypothetical protein
VVDRAWQLDEWCKWCAPAKINWEIGVEIVDVVAAFKFVDFRTK